MIGTRLAHYEIKTHLGSGGMGDVYQAADTKLDRNVAIKFLPEAFSHDSERLARFQREARVLASLNHPNIASIFGVEETGGRHFLVMELVPGETLEARIARGAIPLDEILLISKQIAEALESAHEQGIIHRDLKPANIKVRPDGAVKVLDFGLAKAYEREQVDGSRSNSPTISMAVTNAGVILGTAGYMSPEQASGKHVDKRADIWSFGVVLWEMLTGSRLFGGETVSHLLADVLRAPIDFEKISDERLRELLRRCLDRDVKTRLRDMGEARVALSRPLSRTEMAARPAGPAQESSRLWQVVAVALAISTAVVLWAPWHNEPERPLRRLEVDLGPDVSLVPNAGQIVVALSPDGTRLAYRTAPPPTPALSPAFSRRGEAPSLRNIAARLFVRRLDQVKAVELTDGAGASNFFFSPDSQWIAFSRNATLYKISVEGGAAVPLAEFSDGGNGGGDWGEDGTIVVGGSTGLFRIPQGGKPVQITKAEDRTRAHLYPHILPGGKTLLFSVLSGERNASSSAIEAVSLADGKRKEVLRGAVSAQYLPSGQLIYMSNGALYAIGFDPYKLETRGTAVSILDDVQFNTTTGLASFSFSNNGTFVYRKGLGTGDLITGLSALATIDWIDPLGKHTSLVTQPQRFSRPRFSPDGNQLAVLITDPESRDYWVYDLRRGTRNRITVGDLAVSTVAWTPDSRYIFLGSGNGGKPGTIGIYWTPADGAGRPQRLLEEKAGVNFVSSYSAQAKRLMYSSLRGDIFTLPVTEENGQWKAGGPAEVFFPTTEFREFLPVFSPDGRWVAYSTDEQGRLEVAVRPFQPPSSSDKAKKWIISTNGGTRPNWSRDGRELFYQEGDRLMVVSYTVNGDTFNPSSAVVRVAKLGANAEDWDLSLGGHVAAVTPVESGQPAAAPPGEHTVVFLENFFNEVQRRAK